MSMSVIRCKHGQHGQNSHLKLQGAAGLGAYKHSAQLCGKKLDVCRTSGLHHPTAQPYSSLQGCNAPWVPAQGPANWHAMNTAASQSPDEANAQVAGGRQLV